MNKRGLGRGLGALLGPESGPSTDAALEIPIDRVRPNPRQPRKRFDGPALTELTDSIRSSGVIQPIVVRRTGDAYELIAGERRWRAAKQAGLATIPAVVRDVTNAESLELALVENLLREDLNPIEAAEGYRQLLADFGWTQEQLGQRIGKDRSSIANALRLLRLPEPIQEDLRGGGLSSAPRRLRVDARATRATDREGSKLDRERSSSAEASRTDPGGSTQRRAHDGSRALTPVLDRPGRADEA
jgi:ParB family transcriptional regulator, chromosome partitioning protein